MNREKNFVSAVVYVHNNECNIKEFLEMLISVFENNFEHSEIICVNDYSDDNSAMLIKEYSSQVKATNVSLINMSYYHGIEMSMHAGLDLAIGDFVYEFDNTFVDYDSGEIMHIYRKSLEGYDIVSASVGDKQKLSSKLFYYAFNKFANFSAKMQTESFRILSRRVINRVSSMNKTIPYRKAVYANCGLKTANIVYTAIEKNKNRKSDRKEEKYRSRLAIDTMILFTEVGYRFSISMTVLMMLIATFMLIYSFVVYAASNPVAGWTTTILFLSIAFLGLFGILTIIIRYLQILVDLVFRRKRYNFESIEKLTK